MRTRFLRSKGRPGGEYITLVRPENRRPRRSEALRDRLCQQRRRGGKVVGLEVGAEGAGQVLGLGFAVGALEDELAVGGGEGSREREAGATRRFLGRRDERRVDELVEEGGDAAADVAVALDELGGARHLAREARVPRRALADGSEPALHAGVFEMRTVGHRT